MLREVRVSIFPKVNVYGGPEREDYVALAATSLVENVRNAQ